MDINCDMGESFGNWAMGDDKAMMSRITTANVACGFHASDPVTMIETVKLAKNNDVVIGSHPGLPDLLGFGRRAMNITPEDAYAYMIYQTGALDAALRTEGMGLHHIKPHGALNNMACEDIDLATTIAKSIKEISKDLIYLVPTGSKMEEAAKKLDMKIACEIFADRNYEDDGNLVSRSKPNALITNPEEAKSHVLQMVEKQALNCLSGKKIPCKIDSVCIHGDNISSLETAKSIKKNLIENNMVLMPLNKMKKFC